MFSLILLHKLSFYKCSFKILELLLKWVKESVVEYNLCSSGYLLNQGKHGCTVNHT